MNKQIQYERKVGVAGIIHVNDHSFVRWNGIDNRGYYTVERLAGSSYAAFYFQQDNVAAKEKAKTEAIARCDRG